MNLQELWAGTDYAWYEDKGRGEKYRPYAKRVKVIRAFKQRIYGNQRESGFAEVMLLDDDGEPQLKQDGSHRTKEIRARDIAMRWEPYAEERAYREAQREKMAREQEEAEQRETELKSRLRELLETKYGLPSEAISSIGSSSIYLVRSWLEEELGSKEDTGVTQH